MSEAIRIITGHYAQMKDRVALEKMREHRNKLLQNYRMGAAQGFKVPALESSLQGDMDAIDEALARIST